MDMKDVIKHMPVDESFTKQQFSNKVRETNADYSDSSISWLLSELKREQRIASIGRGVYIRVTEESRKREYLCLLKVRLCLIFVLLESRLPTCFAIT